MKYYIIVDMQNDFVKNPPFATPEAQAIIPYIRKKILNADENIGILFTQDTHFYGQDSIEALSYPKHCRYATPGWCIIDELYYFTDCSSDIWQTVEKNCFGVDDWYTYIDNPESIIIMGVCTDICVISNALILRSLYPETEIIVDSKGCAGTSPEMHESALRIMEKNCIKII